MSKRYTPPGTHDTARDTGPRKPSRALVVTVWVVCIAMVLSLLIAGAGIIA